MAAPKRKLEEVYAEPVMVQVEAPVIEVPETPEYKLVKSFDIKVDLANVFGSTLSTLMTLIRKENDWNVRCQLKTCKKQVYFTMATSSMVNNSICNIKCIALKEVEDPVTKKKEFHMYDPDHIAVMTPVSVMFTLDGKSAIETFTGADAQAMLVSLKEDNTLETKVYGKQVQNQSMTTTLDVQSVDFKEFDNYHKVAVHVKDLSGFSSRMKLSPATGFLFALYKDDKKCIIKLSSFFDQGGNGSSHNTYIECVSVKPEPLEASMTAPMETEESASFDFKEFCNNSNLVFVSLFDKHILQTFFKVNSQMVNMQLEDSKTPMVIEYDTGQVMVYHTIFPKISTDEDYARMEAIAAANTDAMKRKDK
jgi:hypothetical protein